ncbi:hypothetical protein KEM55_006613, partial [Ascosphaera atra]
RHAYASPPQTQTTLPLPRQFSLNEKDSKTTSHDSSPTLSSYPSYSSLHQNAGPSPPPSTHVLSPASSDLGIPRTNRPYIQPTTTADSSYYSHGCAYGVTPTTQYQPS